MYRYEYEAARVLRLKRSIGNNETLRYCVAFLLLAKDYTFLLYAIRRAMTF